MQTARDSVGSVERAAATQDVIEAWARLRAHLEAKAKAMNADVARYPRPIARCDDQLPKLIEQRDLAQRRLQRSIELGATPAADAELEWLERIEELPADDEDAAETALHERLRSAVERRRAELRSGRR